MCPHIARSTTSRFSPYIGRNLSLQNFTTSIFFSLYGRNLSLQNVTTFLLHKLTFPDRGYHYTYVTGFSKLETRRQVLFENQPSVTLPDVQKLHQKFCLGNQLAGTSFLENFFLENFSIFFLHFISHILIILFLKQPS